jgi:hypothetical protein
MKYQEALEKMPNATYLYEGVTQEELDKIAISKYEIEDDSGEGLHIVGAAFEIPELSQKKMTYSVGMKFG